MFDSTQMHMPIVIFLGALFLLLLIGGIYVAVRVKGQRVVDDEAGEHVSRRPNDRI